MVTINRDRFIGDNLATDGQTAIVGYIMVYKLAIEGDIVTPRKRASKKGKGKK